ncbi:caskin-2-like, partial [Serinus canaria]|uniref:caskin-2-like n=1 Tax=Serinus canaria TaxID=9135 RepID=UPI0021CC8817
MAPGSCGPFQSQGDIAGVPWHGDIAGVPAGPLSRRRPGWRWLCGGVRGGAEGEQRGPHDTSKGPRGRRGRLGGLAAARRYGGLVPSAFSPARGGALGGRGSRPPLRQTQAAIVTLRQSRPISARRPGPHVGAAPSDWLAAARPPGFCPPPAAPLRPGAVAAPRARAPLPRSAPAPRWLPELRRSRLDAAERPPPGGGPARTSHVRGAREVGCFSASPGALRGRRAAAAAPHVAIAVARLGAAASSDRAPARPCTPRAGTRLRTSRANRASNSPWPSPATGSRTSSSSCRPSTTASKWSMTSWRTRRPKCSAITL